jgi:hypothetical protein
MPLYFREGTPVPFEQEVGWVPEPVWVFRTREEAIMFMFKFKGVSVQQRWVSAAVYLSCVLVWDVKQRRSFFLDILTLEDGTDT